MRSRRRGLQLANQWHEQERGEEQHRHQQQRIVEGEDEGLALHHARQRLQRCRIGIADARDQLTLEFAGAYRHYDACLMRTIPIGKPLPGQREMHKVAVDALEACKAALKPGRPIAEVFDAYARVCDAAGHRAHRLNATGYSLGTTYAPNWMDWPMFYHGNPELAAPGMVFFIHIILFDAVASGLHAHPASFRGFNPRKDAQRYSAAPRLRAHKSIGNRPRTVPNGPKVIRANSL